MEIPHPCEACGRPCTEAQMDDGALKFFDQGDDPEIVVHRTCLIPDDQEPT